MKTFIESLSVWSGAILVAIVSAGFVWLLCVVFPKLLRKLWVVIVPLVIAYFLYWSPVWLGADPSEYGAWKFVIIPPWFLAGAISSAATVRLQNRGGRQSA